MKRFAVIICVLLSNHSSTHCQVTWQTSAQLKATYTFGFHARTSGFNFSVAIGGSEFNSWQQFGLNIFVSLYQVNLGTANGTRRSFILDGVISPSLTFASEKSSDMAVRTFTGSAESGVISQFKYSLTLGQNFILSTERDRRYQRAGSYGLRIDNFAMNIYNDSKKILGDGGDRWWTGGGTATVNLGNGNSISFGTEPFTGNSIASRVLSAPFDATMPTYNIPGKGSFHYAAQYMFDAPSGRPAGYNQSLNMGHTFVRFDSNYFTLQVSHSGKAHMYSQNLIHDYLTNAFHRFLSLVTNQLNITAGGRAGIE